MKPCSSHRHCDSAWVINYVLTAAALIALGFFTLANHPASTARPDWGQLISQSEAADSQRIPAGQTGHS